METNFNEKVEIDEPELESEEKKIDTIENESTQETLRAIDRANTAAERLELANKKRE